MTVMDRAHVDQAIDRCRECQQENPDLPVVCDTCADRIVELEALRANLPAQRSL